MTPTRQMWKFFTPVRTSIWGASTLSALTYLASIALLATSGWLISHAALRPPILTLEIAIVGVRTFALSRGVTRYAERLVSHNATFAALTDLRVAVYESLETRSTVDAASVRDGDLLSRIVDDVDEIQNLPLRVVIPFTACVLSSIFAIGLSLWILPAAGCVLLLTLLLALLGGSLATSRATKQSDSQTAELRGEFNAQVIEFLAGTSDLEMMNATQASLADIAEVSTTLAKAQKRQAWSQGLGSAIITGSQGLALVGTLLCGISAVNSHALSGANLAALVFVPLAAFEAILVIPQAVSALAQLSGSAERLADLLAFMIPPQDSDHSPGDSGISLVNLYAGWSDLSQDALKDITLNLPSGSRHALVGRSGSGKSTLAHVLGKFLVPRHGNYYLGDRDTTELSDTRVREHVVVLAQEAHIFATSIRENLHVGLPHGLALPTDDDLRNVLDQVGLTNDISELPQGLDTIVGDRGATLSGGQRRRLALARMFLARPLVWVLDEPTEHLDPATAQIILTNIGEALESSSLVLITHQMFDAATMGQITVIEKGVIRESGSPEQLAVAHGHYHKLLEREQLVTEKLSGHN